MSTDSVHMHHRLLLRITLTNMVASMEMAVALRAKGGSSFLLQRFALQLMDFMESDEMC